jgi:menaquinone-9 beta-reductase
MEGFLFFATAFWFRCQARIATDARRRKILSPEVVTEPPKVDFATLIVGAGPAGSTSAYYLGRLGVKVALCDKKSFPRPKPCGDAWCKPALDILEDMGVLAKMEKDGITHAVKRGGLISPFGHKCINTDGDAYGAVTGCKQRIAVYMTI